MSSKNKKQRHRRLRPNKPNQAQQKNIRSRPGRFMIGIAVILGAAAIIYAVTRPKSPSGPGATTPAALPPTAAQPARVPPAAGPRFDAGAQVYDFGRAEGDNPVDCLVLFTNSGTALLEITDVAPGCSCMKAGEWTKQVEPGQTGTIAVRLDTRHYTGPFGKSVFVTCNDANQPKARLEIKGYVYRALEITPPSAVMNLSHETPSSTAAVRVISHMDEPISLSDLQVSLANLAVDLQTNTPGKEYQINVRPLPPLPTSSQQGQITFKTSAAKVPSTNVSVSVNFVPILQALPFQLRLPPTPLTNAVSLMAWVRNNGTNPLVVSSATVNLPDVEVQSEDDPMNRGRRFTLNFPAGFDLPPGTNAELAVKTTHPQYPDLRVPIIQPVRRANR